MILLLAAVSRLPFFILHRFSDGLYYFLYYGLRYRRKVVRENLLRSFPERPLPEIVRIEKKFYSNFCDILIETLKNFSIPEKEFLDRCKYMTPGPEDQWFAEGRNIMGISSHLANWECLALALGHRFKQICYGVYKPLSNKKMDAFAVESRQHFGIRMIPIKKVREVMESPHDRPYVMGLLSDQAPHDYSRAFEVQFLNQKTFVVPGPGVLTVKNNLLPIWGWMRRTGRSRFEWGVEEIAVDAKTISWSEDDQKQIARMAEKHEMTLEQSAQALAIVIEYSKRLEAQIRSAPEDWLWSHRRWKSR